MLVINELDIVSFHEKRLIGTPVNLSGIQQEESLESAQTLTPVEPEAEKTVQMEVTPIKTRNLSPKKDKSMQSIEIVRHN